MQKYTGFDTIQPLNLPYKIKLRGALIASYEPDIFIFEIHGKLYGLEPLMNKKFIDQYNFYKIENEDDINKLLENKIYFYSLNEIFEIEKYSINEVNGKEVPQLKSNIFTILYDFETDNTIFIFKSKMFSHLNQDNKLTKSQIKDYIKSLSFDLKPDLNEQKFYESTR